MKILIEESVLRQALNYLETASFRDSDRDEAITALRTALDAAEKVEPVAWKWSPELGGGVHYHKNSMYPTLCQPLYLHPQNTAPTIPEGLVAFLNGSAPLDGVWFGEDHPTERGKFWWRKYLTAAPKPEEK